MIYTQKKKKSVYIAFILVINSNRNIKASMKQKIWLIFHFGLYKWNSELKVF